MSVLLAKVTVALYIVDRRLQLQEHAYERWPHACATIGAGALRPAQGGSRYPVCEFSKRCLALQELCELGGQSELHGLERHLRED